MKRILAIVLSIAILVMAFPISVFAAEPTVATDTWDGTTTEPTAIDDDGNIIINTAEELAWIALKGDSATAGKSYKVADGIDAFYLTPNGTSSYDNSSFDKLKETLTADTDLLGDTLNKWHSKAYVVEVGGWAAFQGSFDGNGITIYGMPGVSTDSGTNALFPYVKGDVSFKNFKITDSYVSSKHNVGGIVGAGFKNESNINSISFEKCVVTGNYLEQTTKGTSTGWCSVGGLAASIAVVTKSINVNNCIIVENNIVNASSELNKSRGFFAQWQNYDTAVVTVSIKNSITDINPYSNGYYPNNPANYSNVYTTCTDGADYYTSNYTDANVKVLTSAEMQGNAAKNNMSLAWEIDWQVGLDGEYPSVIFKSPEGIDAWDGTFSEPTETDAEGNILITSAEEMAWVALRGADATEGKSYKVADGIKYFNMNGSVGITANSTASEVQSATAAGNMWSYSADGKSSAFKGNFDGNGVTVFNIRTNKHGYSGLFPFVHNDSTIENVILKASYIAAYHYAGGIVGGAEYQKTLNVNKCAVVNCYITDNGDTNTACTRAAAQFVAGTGNSNVNISNCFAADNTLSAAGFEAGFVATTGAFQPTGTSITNSISIGMYPYSTVKTGDLGKGLTEKLTVENIYSDIDCDIAGFTTLSTDQMQGSAAKENMALAWNTDWLVGAEGEYPSINFGEPIKDPYVWDGTFKEPTETDDEGNIIINTVNEMAWVALRGGDATANKNYRVADGIQYFNMNGAEGITVDSTVADVKAATKTANLWRLEADGTSPAFQGNFDGNGVIVYNIYTGTGRSHSGLFPATNSTAQGSITIKNIAVVASHIGGYHGAAGIVGIANTGNTSTSMTFEKCVVKNCFITDNNDTNPATKKIGGIITGEMVHNAATINNCLAINNEIASQGIKGGFFGNSSDYAGKSTVSNSISIGTTAEPVSFNTALATKVATTTYTTVYTDQSTDVSGVTTLENSKMQGSVATVTMDALDDSVWFFNTTTYPELYVFHSVVDGKCECGLEIAGDPCVDGHTLESVEGYDATNFTNGLLAHDVCSVCGKTFIDGVQKSAEELIIPMLAKTWNGNFVEPTETDADGNIIINTPEELAWVALRGGSATIGKNYKVAKDSVFNLNGMEGITPFSTTADVKAVGCPKADAYGSNYAWRFAEDKNDSTPFGGNFDGNGLIIYNLFSSKSRGSAGLFPVTKTNSNGTITIKNVTIMASHIGGYHNAGGIIGIADAPDSSTKLVIENCAVKNCYIYDNDEQNAVCHRTTGTLVGNLLHNATTINNCLVVDNELSAQGIIGGLFGNTSNYGGANTVKNVISIGTAVQPTMVNYTINDKVSQTTYINVYTDQVASADGITTLTTDKMQGAAAADNMSLNWNINWAVGAEGEYPSIITDNAFYDEWDGTFVEPTKNDDEGNILITSAEEMAWVALRGDTATEGKNYKVADGVKYFNMNGMIGITLDSTVDDVKNATKDAAKAWVYAEDGKVGTFYGNFDGNGVTIYNIYTVKGRGYGGLFPVIKPATEGVITIKNVAVVASYIGGYHNAAAIIGLADSPDSSTGLSLENIIVKNNFIYDNEVANSACQRTAGVLVGNLTHNTTLINNVFVSGNELSAQGIIGGLFGNSSIYASAINVSNVISIGTKVEPNSISYAISDKVADTVYASVYTDQATELTGVATFTVDEMSGENALENTTLDWSAWFATVALPELRVFHNVTSTDNGDGTHSDSCSDCDLSGFNTPHTYLDGSCVVCDAKCTHVAGEPVVENTVDATCMTEGSYDLVVYCSVCGEVISKTTEIIEINPENHTFDDEHDADCNNGCGFTRVTYTLGDVNGDGDVNARDCALIMQYINHWDVADLVNLSASDVNGDSSVNAKDYALIMQYINGWDVVFTPKA